MTKVIIKPADGTGAVETYHNAAKKFETTSTGATVTGDLAVTGGLTANNYPYGKNLLTNGAMLIAQRKQGTSSTSGEYVVDMQTMSHGDANEAPVASQANVAAGTDPYNLGFRKCFKITNGNQTTTDAGDSLAWNTRAEQQDLANCGWNSTSATDYMTVSFWMKSSVAQNFYGYIHIPVTGATTKRYPFETGSVSADTWTKITKTFPGHADIALDQTTALGVAVHLSLFAGTDQTGTVTLNQWMDHDNSNRFPANTSTFWTTDNATFEVTGVKLEYNPVATPFVLNSFAEDLAICQRYYHKTYLYSTDPGTAEDAGSIFCRNYSAAGKQQHDLSYRFPVRMRETPTTVAVYAVHSGTVNKVSAGGTHPPAAHTEITFHSLKMLSDQGFSGIQTTTNVDSLDYVGAHFTFDAKL